MSEPTTEPAVQFTFTEEEPPKTERASKPNPFTAIVGQLATDGKGAGFDVPDGHSLSTVRSQLDRAGEAQSPQVSVHWKVNPKGAKSGPAHVFIRTTPKIKQNRTKDAAAPETDA